MGFLGKAIKGRLRKKYGDFPDDDLHYVWCKSYFSVD